MAHGSEVDGVKLDPRVYTDPQTGKPLPMPVHVMNTQLDGVRKFTPGLKRLSGEGHIEDMVYIQVTNLGPTAAEVGGDKVDKGAVLTWQAPYNGVLTPLHYNAGRCTLQVVFVSYEG